MQYNTVKYKDVASKKDVAMCKYPLSHFVPTHKSKDVVIFENTYWYTIVGFPHYTFNEDGTFTVLYYCERM